MERERGKISAPSTSSLSVELLSPVIDVKYGCFTFTFFKQFLPNTEIYIITLKRTQSKLLAKEKRNTVGFLLT